MVTPTPSRKLRTNDPPTEMEAAVVRRATERSLNKLKVIENEAIRLQERLAVLCRRKKDFEDFVEIHMGLLSPIRRLHRDILQEIFYLCLPIAHNSVFDPDAAPLVLGRVCGSWRRIAYTTPKLWSSLHIVVVPSTFYSAGARFNAISAWISRSGALPLSISMSVSGFPSQSRKRYVPTGSQVTSYMELILTHVKRWKRIHLSQLSYDWARFFYLVNASDLPLLEVLHLEGRPVKTRGSISFDISPPSRKGGILFSPMLHVLSLPEYSRRLLELPIQWKQITALNLARRILPLGDIIKVLPLGSNLQTCTITIATSDQQSLPAASTLPPIFLPNLRTLKVTGKSVLNNDLLILIDKLSTPRLRHFAYVRRVNWNTRRTHPSLPQSQSSESSQFMKSLCPFFQKLNEPLEEFDYCSNSLTRRDMMNVLSCVPGLKRLSLSLRDFNFFSMSNSGVEGFDDRFLAQFIPYEHRVRYLFDDDFEEVKDEDEVEDNHFPTSTCLCPKLEVLNSIDAVYSERILVEFLRSRSVDHLKYNVSRLHHASITFATPDTMGQVKDMTKQLERLEKDTSLVVNLRYPEVPFGPPTPLLFDNKSPFNGIYSMLSSGLNSNLGFIKFNL